MKNNVRHVVVFNTDNFITKIISQGALFNYIHKNILQNPDILLDEDTKYILDCRISEFDIIKDRKVKYITDSSMKIIDAFRYMTKYYMSSIALVSNDNNVLIDVISLSDIKSLSGCPNYDLSKMSVNEFLEIQSVANPSLQKILITGKIYDNIRTTIDQLVKNKIHQIYIVDENMKLLNYISYTDILHILF